MFSLFKRGGAGGEGNSPERTRVSRGWAEVLAYLKDNPTPSLRVLDFGATSPNNINLITALGHSVYMANIVQDASRPEWLLPLPFDARRDAQPEYDTARFAAATLDFSGRDFDVILLWDTADYLPPPLVPILFSRLREVTRPQGRLLAFFHGKTSGPETGFSRYHLTETSDLRVQASDTFPVRQVIQNRQIERYLEGFSSVRFIQGADNLREVIARH